jgi:peptidyl-prolyl cis-trans isomerase D
MLQFLRKRAQSLLIQAIVVIIALVFIFWGVGTNMMNKQEAAIVVDNEEISFQQFQQAYDQAYARLAQQFGGTVPKGLAESLNIKQQVISQLTQEALLRQGGQEMGLMVSGKEIQDEIEAMVQFQDNGRFDIERYQTILAANRLSPEKYEQSLRYELLGNKTIASIGAFADVATDFEIEELYNLEKETLSVSYTAITPESFIDDIVIDDGELAAWYEANSAAYQTEKEVQLGYLPFLYRDIGERITIEEGQVSSYYDDHITDYQVPEKRHARHILFRASPEDSEEIHQSQLAKAEEVLEKAKSGEDFAGLAQQYSEGPTAATGGDLGFFAKAEMVKPFSEAVFSMEPGQISDVVKTDFGYHIIKLEEVQLGGVKTLDEVREEIVSKLRLEQAKPLAFQLANTAYEEIIGAGSLDAYLDTQPDAELIETPFFKRSKPPAGVTSDPAFLDTAFDLKAAELSSIVETADGYVIISAEAIKEPQVPDLATIRDEVAADYRAEKAAEKAEEAAKMLISEAQQDGSSLEQAAKARNLEVQKAEKLMKNDPAYQSSFPQQLVADAFRLSSSAPVSPEPGVVDNIYYVYRFDQRTPPEKAMSEEDRARYRELLIQFKQQRLLDAWIRNRQAEADIHINKSLENF